MRLAELLPTDEPDVEVSGLAYRSDAVTRGDLFFCVRGFRVDGHDYAADAVKRGASALVCERRLDLAVSQVVVDDVRAVMGAVADRFYGHPSRQIPVVGITGTNGKTTTAHLVRSLLEQAGIQCGLLGTVGSVVSGRNEPAERTTPEAPDLQHILSRMRDGGDRACVMEVSSHALALDRVAGIEFACRVFTNLTQDHLDFHPTMEDYFQAKRRLFAGPKPSVVNIDNSYGARLAAELENPITCAIEQPAEFRAREVSFTASGCRFACDTPNGTLELKTPLAGLFNVQNALCAVACASVLDIDSDAIVSGLSAAPLVPGRFEPIDAGQDFAVLVDYAHTPEALANVLQAAREVCSHTLWVIFGAGGDRDRTKRALMGEAAARYADRVLITSDNPRSEDPEAIIADVARGAPEAEQEVDRRRAIERCVRAAQAGDVVVVAGKGHEQGQEFAGGRKYPFDDATVAREALEARLTGTTRAGGPSR